MTLLTILITKEVANKQEAQVLLDKVKAKVAGTGCKLSASHREMLEKPTEQ